MENKTISKAAAHQLLEEGLLLSHQFTNGGISSLNLGGEYSL